LAQERAGQKREVTPGEGAGDPEAELVERPEVEHQHRRGEGGEQGRKRRAGERERDRRRARAAGGAEREDGLLDVD